MSQCGGTGLTSYRPYRRVRYRYRCCTNTCISSGTDVRTGTGGDGCRTDLTDVPGTGIDVAPNLFKDPVPILISSRSYRGVRYRYRCCAEVAEVSGAGIDAVPNTPLEYSTRRFLAEVCRLCLNMSKKRCESVRLKWLFTALCIDEGQTQRPS